MKVISQSDAEVLVKTGVKEFNVAKGDVLTPGARDVLREFSVRVNYGGAASPSAGGSASNTAADSQLFNSPLAEKLKKEICDIGRRIWLREYCDGNGGNISVRLTPDRFLVTPTGVSKGFLTPEMISLVDGTGKQLAGTWKRSSEFMTHLAIYKATPDAVSVCHAHPCHAGAFAIKQLHPPARLIPELEVFVGEVPVARYDTPGSAATAEAVGKLAPTHQSIIMGLHGVICWGKSVEDAYFKMEITDAYCRTVILAQALPGQAAISGEKMGELLELKKKMGLPDSRFGLKPAELCEVDPWEEMCGSHGCSSPVTPWNPMTVDANQPATDAETEALVQQLTDAVLAKIKA
ncbi:MAG: class II aldolase/adducin family protein [Verrucomicrobiales bacterium]|jgi:L-fuculose-phosphate aldolase|nr:class II aldolase/adducin family protein [Verrucomicrobiales bacterium]